LPGPAPGNRGNAGRDDRGSGRARARFPGRRAGPEAVSGEPPRRQQTRAGPPECEPARLGAAPSRAGTPPGASAPASAVAAGDQLLNLVVEGDRRLPLRLVAGIAQAGGRRRRRLRPGSLSVSGTRRRRDHGERAGRQAPGDAGRLSCGVCGEHPVPVVVGDGIRAQARSASGVPAASGKHRHADPLPASPARERVAGFAVHNHVDHLCKTAPGLCAHWGNAGDRVTGPRP